MVLAPKVNHPEGDQEISHKEPENSTLVADTFDGKIHIEWNPQAQVTPLGQLPFLIQYLKMGHLFGPWVDKCALTYTSNNAPKKSIFSVLCYCPFCRGNDLTLDSRV
jgi:hypothetical protein